MCHWCLYKLIVRLFEHEKYHILTAELYVLVRSFDEKTSICDACHKHLSINEMSSQAIFSKISLDSIPDELKDFKKLKILISKRTILHPKEDFTKIKGSICNIPNEATNICNILPRPADSNGLIVVKLKRDQGLCLF